MNTPRGTRRCGLQRTLSLGLLILLTWLTLPLTAQAHPLDVYLQATYLTVAPARIVVELDLTPGVLITLQVLPQLDSNGDGQISDAEGRAYVDTVLRDVVLQVDGQSLTLAVTKIEMPAYLNIQAGYGAIRVFTLATLPDGMTGTHRITYANNNAPPGAAYQVNAFVDKGVVITLGKQNRDRIQQAMTMDYAIGGALPTPTAPVATAATVATGKTAATTGTASATTPNAAPAGTSGMAARLLAYLYAPVRSPWVLLLALALAGVVGGLHALTPGHGKTLVAAYLIGSRGTVRHAAALGAIVTFTHTASVIVIGLLALFASQFIVPNVLVPTLEILSGVLVVGMGTRLGWQRWATFRRRHAYRAHTPDDSGAANHRHDSVATSTYTHDHGDGHTHSHSHLPPAAGLTLGSLVAMGVSGGLVPCPEALGIMIVAIGLNRVVLGLGLIVSFSFGLAAVLIAIGILLVRARPLVERFGGRNGRWSSGLPLISAAIVTVLGVGITLRGLAMYRGRPAFGGYLVAFAALALVTVLLGKRLAMRTAMVRARSSGTPGENAAYASIAAPLAENALLPPRYRNGRAVSAAPMAAAPLVYEADGEVAWNRMWGGDDPENPFCALALAGGPPHRGTLLEPVEPEAVRADPEGYARVMATTARGLGMVTGLNVVTDGVPGWIGLACENEDMALWLLRAILVENVSVRREGCTLFLPIGPTFRIDGEIKNVVTAVAKTHHYWAEHRCANTLSCRVDTRLRCRE